LLEYLAALQQTRTLQPTIQHKQAVVATRNIPIQVYTTIQTSSKKQVLDKIQNKQGFWNVASKGHLPNTHSKK
jgi:hypothetical protein